MSAATIEPSTVYPTREKLEELSTLAFGVHNDLDVIRQRLGRALDETEHPPVLDLELFGWIVHHGRSIKAQAESIAELVDSLLATADSLVQETVVEPAWQAAQARRESGETE